MKRTILIANCLLIAYSLIAARPSPEELALCKARQHGAEAQERLRVVDFEGHPVAGARVWGGLQTGDSLNDYIEIRGQTNTNGEFVISGKCTNRIRCEITKEGYYDSEFLVTNYGYTHSLKDGKWQPYGSMRTVVLKKMKNPIEFTRRHSDFSYPPSLGTWYGYDLLRRQWVTDDNGDLHKDVLIRIAVEAKNKINDFKTVMEVSFTNNPFAGAYMMKKDEFSEMASVYNADTNACYQSSFVFVFERHPIVKEKPFRYVDGSQRIDTRLQADSYLVFRTRTVIDENGRLISAHYGKIDGPWEFYGGMCAKDVLFNVTPNDLNLEDLDVAERSRRRIKQRERLVKQIMKD